MFLTIQSNVVNGDLMTNTSETRIPCSLSTRRLVKAQKRGGESYDELLRKMVRQYEPEKHQYFGE